MIAYASRTGTRRNLRELARFGWRLMLSPAGVLRTEGFRYALDNGAWSAFQNREPFDNYAFTRALASFGRAADFVVAPDVVGDWPRSWELTRSWLPTVARRCRLPLIAVQDGATPADVEPYVGPGVGVFIGGTTEWKLRALPRWGPWCGARRIYLHVGRVNSARRVASCRIWGACSFDGSGPSRFSVETARLSGARDTPVLPFVDRYKSPD